MDAPLLVQAYSKAACVPVTEYHIISSFNVIWGSLGCILPAPEVLRDCPRAHGKSRMLFTLQDQQKVLRAFNDLLQPGSHGNKKPGKGMKRVCCWSSSALVLWGLRIYFTYVA